jgi:uncharacterized membrane protein
VWLFARGRLPAGAALALSVAYGSFWGLQRAAHFDFHDYAFAPLIIAVLILAIDRAWWGVVWLSAAALVCVKEDLIPIVVMAGVLIAATRHRRHGIALAAFGLAVFIAVVGAVIPWLSDSGAYEYAGIYTSTLQRPWLLALNPITPPQKLLTPLFWLLPFAFLPLLSPILLLSVPLVLSRLLSEHPAHWGYGFHYSAPLAPILAMSAIDGLARLARRDAFVDRRSFATAVASLSVVLSAFTPGHQPLFELLKPSHYAESSLHRSGEEALRLVPPTASVAAQSSIVPHLTHRDRIFVLAPDAPDADFIVACDALTPWPFARAADVELALDARRRHGYSVMYRENGWTVLRRVPE